MNSSPDRFHCRDDQLEDDLHCCDVAKAIEDAIVREERVTDRKREAALWKDEQNEQ